jgi:hypothetical protein
MGKDQRNKKHGLDVKAQRRQKDRERRLLAKRKPRG